jgi:acetylornithine deacetylase/succinyl-diaminopimelate desuccinylase-like protein
LDKFGWKFTAYIFDQYLKAPTVIIPITKNDNNQHAENENIRIKNLWAGIETYVAFMMME